MNWRWFISKTLRHSVQMRRHVRKLVNAQRDLIPAAGVQSIDTALAAQWQLERQTLKELPLQQGMEQLEGVATKWLKPYPHATFRENIEVLLVAVAVAVAIRTFFLQPFKIPTGSMQPTLYGITHENLIDRPDVTIPSRSNPARLWDFWFNGVGYTHVVAKADGAFEIIDENPTRVLLFNFKQSFRIGGVVHTVWFPPENLFRRAGLVNYYGVAARRAFRKGQDVIKLKAVSGDHLFVDRFTYNFRRPRRGEIVVFETKGIPELPRDQQDQYYIKRLVGLGGDRISIGDDRHLRVNGQRLDASTPHFELVYSFDGPPRESTYSGHVNAKVATEHGFPGSLAPKFRDATQEQVLAPDRYMVMGDNTVNSSDSRFWGSFPQSTVIGRSCFVYWPIGTQPGRMGRFGIAHR